MNTALCTYDIWTASLNYQYIKDKSKIDTSTVNLLNGYNQSSNELNLIGVNLAKRLHINKLNYIDNLQDETILSLDFPSFLLNTLLPKLKSISWFLKQVFLVT